MRCVYTAIFSIVLPVAALAQSYSSAPMVVVSEGNSKPASSAAAPAPTRDAAADFPNFPETAITRVGENTTGQHVDAPPTPASPASPAAAASAKSPEGATAPASPAVPPSPITKLWPRDTVQIFLPPCTGLRPQFVVPCTCVITKLMLAMGHDEFLKESENGTIEQDPRLIKIRTDCATAPKQKE